MATYRVIDLRPGLLRRELNIEASSPEQAGEAALKEKLMRSGRRPFLACRVYWQTDNGTNMTRLYRQQMRF